jgi:hypothetical protein
MYPVTGALFIVNEAACARETGIGELLLIFNIKAAFL